MFSANLTTLRQSKGLSMQQLGEKIGYPSKSARQQVYRWESGEREPNLTNLLKLSEVLNCTLDELAK